MNLRQISCALDGPHFPGNIAFNKAGFIGSRMARSRPGLRPDAAFWYNASIGGWRSFSYYLGELPAWVEDFNARRDLDAYLETVWRPLFGKDQKRFRY